MSVSHCRIDAGVVENQLLPALGRGITKHQYEEMYFSEGSGDDGEGSGDDGEGSGNDDDAPVDGSNMPEGMQLYFMSTYSLLCT